MATTADGARSLRATQILTESRAIIAGDHFVYVTGDHGEGWINKDAIFPHTEVASELCRMLADAVRHLGVDFVCGPATGGLIVSQWTAHHLRVQSIFAEHDRQRIHPTPGGALRNPFMLARGYDELVNGARVLVVDDIVNTGHSVRQTARAVQQAGGDVPAIAALCTRGNTTAADLGCSEFIYLTEILVPSWPADGCRLCAQGVPVNTRYAHGRDFLAAQQAVPG